jgi:hypothetical protein
MDSIDAGRSTMVKAPSSSGKTLLSLYLAKKMKDAGKVTIYLSPNKPLCNEFALFAYTQDLHFAIGTEDFFSLEDMAKADIIICTPPILTKMLLCTTEYDTRNNLIKRVGAVILDELPNSIKSHNEIMPFVMFLLASVNWQTLILSATLPEELRSIILSLFPRINYLEPRDAIRPTDLKIFRMGDKLTEVPTSTLYTPALLNKPQAELSETASRLPISVDEFKRLYDKAKKTFNNFESLTREPTLISPTGRLNGKGLTEFAIQYRQTERKNNKKWDPEREEHLQSIFLENTPTSDELYDLMKKLSRHARLPAMFFHNNKERLNTYHSEITNIIASEEASNEKKRPTKVAHFDERDMLPGDEVGFKEWVSPFGNMGDEELAEIFKHRVDRSRAEGSRAIKLGYRGNSVKKSSWFTGIHYGVGIHHHDIDAPVRDAVESGLRYGYLKVVLCDYTMALGLNMPIKTVVFVGGKDEKIPPEDFVQAAGRAGRWGQDQCGNVMFTGHSAEQVKNIWAPLTKQDTCTFPISESMLLAICTGPGVIKSQLKEWVKYSVPQWNWMPETCQQMLARKVVSIRQWGLITTDFKITPEGEIALSLMDDGDISCKVGYIFSKFGSKLKASIKEKRDFLYVFSHFLANWRVTLEKGHTLTTDPNLPRISEETKQIMREIQEDVAKTFGSGLTPTEKIISLYVVYPNLNSFTSRGYSESQLRSLMAHFLQKMKPFQRQARLPFGDEVLKSYPEFDRF